MNAGFPFIRMKKTTKNADDLRVMVAGTLFLIFLILMHPIVAKFYDQYLAERPFITATVEVLGVKGSPVPVILYDADANQPVRGEWIASVHTFVNGQPQRITSRRGKGNYNHLEDIPKVWSWAAFFDNEQDTTTPEVPTVPFKVCVQYDVFAKDSGVGDETPAFCSVVFDPKNPKNTMLDANPDGGIQ